MPSSSLNAGDPVPLLKDLIRRRSITPADDGVLDVLEAALAPLGFAVTRLGFEGGGSYPVDNLFATRGSGGRHLLFAGHTDVVPPGDTALWSHDPFAADEADGRIFGRGAADMKSGIAAFVAAVARAGDTAGRISLAITNDEEADAVNGTEKLMAWAANAGHRFDFCIVGEPSATARVGDSIKIGRRGSLNGRITATGVQGHVAYPERARNPLPALARAVAALDALQLDKGNDRFPPSNLEFTSIDVGNMASNVVPASGSARFNVRFNDTWTGETLERRLREAITALDTGECTLELSVVGRVSQCFVSPTGEAVEALCRVIEQQTGSRPELATAGGTSDARFIAAHCPVVECGLPGPTMHKADEHVPLADVEALTALYAAFIRQYLA